VSRGSRPQALYCCREASAGDRAVSSPVAKAVIGNRTAHPFPPAPPWQILPAAKREVAAAMKYCDKAQDPSFGIRRVTPRGRTQCWSEGESGKTGQTGLA
jgi:FAD/FMN-containing dehydrogenase